MIIRSPDQQADGGVTAASMAVRSCKPVQLVAGRRATMVLARQRQVVDSMPGCHRGHHAHRWAPLAGPSLRGGSPWSR